METYHVSTSRSGLANAIFRSSLSLSLFILKKVNNFLCNELKVYFVSGDTRYRRKFNKKCLSTFLKYSVCNKIRLSHVHGCLRLITYLSQDVTLIYSFCKQMGSAIYKSNWKFLDGLLLQQSVCAHV